MGSAPTGSRIWASWGRVVQPWPKASVTVAVSAGQGQVTLAAQEVVARLADGHQRRGTGGINAKTRSVEIEKMRDAVRSHTTRTTSDTKGIGACERLSA